MNKWKRKQPFIHNYSFTVKIYTMTIDGRITKNAVVNQLKDERKVVNFSLAINETYKQKAGEYVKVTTYCNCSYWISEKIAENLKKGTLIEVTGRIYVTAYAGGDGCS